MAQYIDKSDLVAEIEKLKYIIMPYPTMAEKVAYRDGIEDTIEIVMKPLEVKEVDLEKEIDNFYGMYRKNGKTFSIEDNQECLDWKVDCNPNFEKAFAKHFFELGMCAANPLTVKDIEKIYHLVNEVSDDLDVRAMYVNIYQETLKRFKDFKERKEK